MAYSTEQIRNIALVGHSGAGKTELSDALLHGAGKIPNKGSVDAGTTVSDSDPREKEIRHSLKTGFCHFDHDGVHVNLLDTPGHPDFIGRALAVLPAVETAAVVVNAATGVETMTQRTMDAAAERHLCRMVVVNRIDAEDVDVASVLEQVQSAFGTECLPVNLPAGNGAKVVDVFFHGDGGETDLGAVEDAHEQIVDQVVEMDDDLMETYLEEGEIAPERLHDAFELALRDGHLVPVCFVSAATGTGIPELLDVIARLMPSPTEGNPPAFVTGPGAQPVQLTPDADAHAVAHVVKVDIDPFRGRMAALRVHQGTLRRGRQIFVGDARKPLKISHLLKLNGADHTEVEAATCGDVCAIPRAEEVFFNAVLHDAHDEDDTRLESTALPEPMYGRAISAESDAQAQKANEALSALCAEDPTLRLDHLPAMNETVLFGIGELHLRNALDEVEEKYGVKVATALPSIAYRETVTGKAEGHHRHKKQTGGAGQFGEVFLRIEPLPRGGRFRVRRQGGGRRDSVAVHTGRGERGARGAARGSGLRLPAAGRAGHRLRRQASLGGLQGDRLCPGRQAGVPERGAERHAHRHGAGGRRQRVGSGTMHGGCGGGPVRHARLGEGHQRAARRAPRGARPGAAERGAGLSLPPELAFPAARAVSP